MAKTKTKKKTFRARVVGTSIIHIHNDLSNMAHYYRELIVERHGEGDNKGITFDCISCLVSLAFSFEAYLNFFGSKPVRQWKHDECEMYDFKKKAKLVLKTLEVPSNMGIQPLKSVKELMKFRNTMAHGKPFIHAYDEVRDIPENSLERPFELVAEWEAFCTYENTLTVYDQVDALLNAMRESSGIEPYDFLTSGNSSVERLT
jgi:hypothetical protein